MNKVKMFFVKVGNFFKGLLTTHNLKAGAQVAADAVVVAADVSKADVPDDIKDSEKVLEDAKNIKVDNQ